MDRRQSIKALMVGTVSSGILVNACAPPDSPAAESSQGAASEAEITRMPEEIVHHDKLENEKFFTAEELATIAVLSDIIIPRDEVSGSATEAGVPEFIEYIVKDMPAHQLPMRGGLSWLDLHCLRHYDKRFTACSAEQQLEVVDQIAYPAKAKPEFRQGVVFFSLMRNLTLSGFYTTEMGVKDVGYIGNRPNQWNGVPEEVLKQYNLAYTEKELKECISFD